MTLRIRIPSAPRRAVVTIVVILATLAVSACRTPDATELPDEPLGGSAAHESISPPPDTPSPPQISSTNSPADVVDAKAKPDDVHVRSHGPGIVHPSSSSPSSTSPSPGASADPALTSTPSAARTSGSQSPSPSPAKSKSSPDTAISAVQPLEYKGVRGGRIAIEIPASVDDVVAMLLDFEHAADNRAWARTFEVIRRTKDRVVARWNFEGRAGINPSCVLGFVVVPKEDGVVVRYKILEDDFGLAAFFGDYRVIRFAESPPRSKLVQRVYIDSGIALVNASADDIATGLREDARRILEWMKKRRQGRPPG